MDNPWVGIPVSLIIAAIIATIITMNVSRTQAASTPKNFEVTLYSAGSLVGQWQARGETPYGTVPETSPGIYRFTDDQGKLVEITGGTVTIVEIK